MINPKWLKPDWEPSLNITNIPIDYFSDIGIELLILDVDGTLLSGREAIISETVRNWIKNAKEKLMIHLFSNNPSKRRVEAVANQLGLDFTYAASKPRRGALRRILNALNVKPAKAAIIGDRIFTDILVGNRLGLYTILVKNISDDYENYKESRIQKIEKKLAQILGA